MRGKVFGIVGLAALLCACLPVQSAQQEQDLIAANTPGVLKGLKGVFILVEDINKDAVEDGLAKEAIVTDVELKLRQSGIRIQSREENFQTTGMPDLSISVNILKDSKISLYAFNIDVSLTENTRLERAPKTIIFGATIWHKGIIGTVGKDNLKDVRESVKDLVDQFCNDYLKANPKK